MPVDYTCQYNVLAYAICKLAKYKLTALSEESLPKYIRALVDQLRQLDTVALDQPHISILVQNFLKQAAFVQLTNVAEEVCSKRKQAHVKLIRAEDASTAWWHQTQNDPHIASLFGVVVPKWRDLMDMLVSLTDALMWLETERKCDWGSKQQQELRDRLLNPIVNGANQALLHLGKFMVEPIPEHENAAFGSLRKAEALDRETNGEEIEQERALRAQAEALAKACNKTK